MNLICNIPCFSIIFSMMAAVITSATKGKTPRRISIGLSILNILFSFILLCYLYGTGESFVYVMGHFPAPWGNEIRAGMLEAGIALLFSFIMLVGILGGSEDLRYDLDIENVTLYYIMIDIMLAANLALVYTNDMFTGYVFIEINTIAACGLILGRFRGRTIASAVQYMIMSLIGSGLVLLGLCFLYDITGHLLMSSIHESLLSLPDQYHVPFLISITFMTIGLAIKSALWPFHTWLPNAYGTSTPTSSVMLSSIISKGYIFFLIKIIYRVVGLETFVNTKLPAVLLILGIIGMISGSVDAIRQANIRRMIAYSSVAQIGYIYMGLGIGTALGAEGSVYHIISHALAKSLAFIAVCGLIKTVNGNFHINSLKGAALKNKTAGVAFMAASFSMIGIPGFAGFVSKFILAKASLIHPVTAILVLSALAVSTLLNTFYFMRVALIIYTPLDKEELSALKEHPVINDKCYTLAVILSVACNLFVGICTSPVLSMIRHGLEIFG